MGAFSAGYLKKWLLVCVRITRRLNFKLESLGKNFKFRRKFLKNFGQIFTFCTAASLGQYICVSSFITTLVLNCFDLSKCYGHTQTAVRQLIVYYPCFVLNCFSGTAYISSYDW